MIQLLALLLTVPPVPPPPADRYAAAKELLHVAPLPPSLKAQLRNTAASVYSYGVIPGGRSDDYDRRRRVEQLMIGRVAGDDKFDADFDECMTDEIGWKYDLATLNNIETIVATPGGKALWSDSIVPTAEKCFHEVMPTFLQYTGFASAIRWFVAHRPNKTLPAYGMAKTSLDALSAELVEYCGTPTGDALVQRSGKLGIREAWADKRRNSAAVACLVQSATLAGYDLPILQTDASTVKLIMTS